jgi:hypothetical protein
LTTEERLKNPPNYRGGALIFAAGLAVIAAFMVACLLLIPQRAGQHPGETPAVEPA